MLQATNNALLTTSIGLQSFIEGSSVGFSNIREWRQLGQKDRFYSNGVIAFNQILETSRAFSILGKIDSIGSHPLFQNVTSFHSFFPLILSCALQHVENPLAKRTLKWIRDYTSLLSAWGTTAAIVARIVLQPSAAAYLGGAGLLYRAVIWTGVIPRHIKHKTTIVLSAARIAVAIVSYLGVVGLGLIGAVSVGALYYVVKNSDESLEDIKKYLMRGIQKYKDDSISFILEANKILIYFPYIKKEFLSPEFNFRSMIIEGVKMSLLRNTFCYAKTWEGMKADLAKGRSSHAYTRPVPGTPIEWTGFRQVDIDHLQDMPPQEPLQSATLHDKLRYQVLQILWNRVQAISDPYKGIERSMREVVHETFVAGVLNKELSPEENMFFAEYGSLEIAKIVFDQIETNAELQKLYLQWWEERVRGGISSSEHFFKDIKEFSTKQTIFDGVPVLLQHDAFRTEEQTKDYAKIQEIFLEEMGIFSRK